MKNACSFYIVFQVLKILLLIKSYKVATQPSSTSISYFCYYLFYTSFYQQISYLVDIMAKWHTQKKVFESSLNNLRLIFGMLTKLNRIIRSFFWRNNKFWCKQTMACNGVLPAPFPNKNIPPSKKKKVTRPVLKLFTPPSNWKQRT